MRFPGQDYWSRLPCSSSWDLPNLWIKPRSPALHADSLPPEPPGKPLYITCGIENEMIQMNLQNRKRLPDIENKLTVAEGKGAWDGHVHTVIFKMNNKDPLYTAHGTLLSVMWQPGWYGGVEENGYMCMYG